MEIRTYASVGTLESNDVFIEIEPNPAPGITVEISSIVMKQFGESIREDILAVMERFGVSQARIRVNDHGALSCVIQARAETALLRAAKAV